MIDLIVREGMTPEVQQELSTAFATVRRFYEIAEQKMKLVEGIDDDLYIPSVNELRYAGCHLSKATVAPDFGTINGELDKAKKHCKRAIYDALEVGITYYLETLRIFLDDYRTVVISPVIPDLSDAKRKISEIRDFITKPRDEDRAGFWEGCTDRFYAIQLISEEFENSRDELNKIKLQQENDARQFELQKIENELQRKRDDRKHMHRMTLTYAAIALSAVALWYNVYVKNQPANAAPLANGQSYLSSEEHSPQKTAPEEAHTVEKENTR